MSSYYVKQKPLPQKFRIKTAAARQAGTPLPSQPLKVSPTKSVSESVSELRSLCSDFSDDSGSETYHTDEEILESESDTKNDRVHGLGISTTPPGSPIRPPEVDCLPELRLEISTTPPASPGRYAEADDDAPRLERSVSQPGSPIHFYHIRSNSDDRSLVEQPSTINLFQAPTTSKFASNATHSGAGRPAPLSIQRKPLAAHDDRLTQPISPTTAVFGSSISTKPPVESAKASSAEDQGHTLQAPAKEQAQRVECSNGKTYCDRSYAISILAHKKTNTFEGSKEEIAEEGGSALSGTKLADRVDVQGSGYITDNKACRLSSLVPEERQTEVWGSEGRDRRPSPPRTAYSSREWVQDSIHRYEESTSKQKKPPQQLPPSLLLVKSCSLDHLRPAPPPKQCTANEADIHPAERAGPYFNPSDRVILAEVPVDELPPTPSTPDPRRKCHRVTKSSSALRGYESTKLEPTYEVGERLSSYESSPDYHSAESFDDLRQLRTKASSPTLGASSPRISSPKPSDNANLEIVRRPQRQVVIPEVYVPTGAPRTPAPALGRRASLRAVTTNIGKVSLSLERRFVDLADVGVGSQKAVSGRQREPEEWKRGSCMSLE